MDILFAALLGLGAGFISALSTGGGLLAIPGLILIGLSPVTAIATSRLAAVGSGITATIRYEHSHRIIWRYVPIFTLLAVIAGAIGPHVLLRLDQTTVQHVVAYLMLIMLPLLLLDKHVGAKIRRPPRGLWLVGLILLFMVLLYISALGGGGGILFGYVLVFLFGMRLIEANAMSNVMLTIASLVASLTYIRTGNVLFHIAIPMAAGSLVGGYFGANMALTQGSAWVKWVLAAIVVLSSIKLLM